MMASIRFMTPLARSTTCLVTRTSPATRRFLNTDTAPVLTSASARVTGGRSHGHIESDTLKVNLGSPRSLGGDGTKTNPEELFAAGYGACFQAAMTIASEQLGIEMPQKKDDYSIDTTVYLVGSTKEADMGLRVEMKVNAAGVSKEDMDKLIERTKKICPYSRMTEGNMTTNVVAAAVS